MRDRTSWGTSSGNADGTIFEDENGNTFPKGDGIPDAGVPTCQQTFRELVGDLTLNWWPRDDNQLYFTVSNGFKSGGFALGESGQRNATDTGLDTYAPEHIWAFMLGSKNTFFDDKLTLNVEGYSYNYRDQQQVLIDGLSIRTRQTPTARCRESTWSSTRSRLRACASMARFP